MRSNSRGEDCFLFGADDGDENAGKNTLRKASRVQADLGFGCSVYKGRASSCQDWRPDAVDEWVLQIAPPSRARELSRSRLCMQRGGFLEVGQAIHHDEAQAR